MPHLRRATAFFVILLLAQLTLVGSGFTCLPGARPNGESEMASMPGMAGMDMTDMDMGGSPSQPGHSHEPAAPGSDACDLPWAPGGCELMIPCSPHAMKTHSVASASTAAPGHAELAWEFDTPPSAIIPPDPPPPRA